MNKKKTKAFDAVKMMRDIREKISAETQGMTLEQLKLYIAEGIKNRDKVAPVKR